MTTTAADYLNLLNSLNLVAARQALSVMEFSRQNSSAFLALTIHFANSRLNLKFKYANFPNRAFLKFYRYLAKYSAESIEF